MANSDASSATVIVFVSFYLAFTDDSSSSTFRNSIGSAKRQRTQTPVQLLEALKNILRVSRNR